MSLADGVFWAWLWAFALTQAVEAPIYWRALRPRRRRLLWALLPSAVTHPLLWFVLPQLWAGSYVSFLVVGEGCVFAMEAFILRALGVRRALLWSFVANGASFGLGLLLHALGW